MYIKSKHTYTHVCMCVWVPVRPCTTCGFVRLAANDRWVNVLSVLKKLCSTGGGNVVALLLLLLFRFDCSFVGFLILIFVGASYHAIL